jgi:hypothetical protein
VSAGVQPSLWRRIGNSWMARGRKPGAIDLNPEGFRFTKLRRETDVRWSDVVQIDCGTRDTLSIDLFFVVFHTENGNVTIDEYDDGFHPLEGAVLAHWPRIRERWIALQCGPLHQPQFETLWRRASTGSA